MLKVLLKKQMAEIFRSYFYDAKKNRMRSKAAIAGWIVFFLVVMVGVLGGTFGFLAWSMCDSLEAVGMSWLYFLVMGGIAILLGAFGSVFNTYSGLYLSKDNDLLLSLPIPVRTILAARLMGVYLMGAMYTATVLLPTLFIYWCTAGATAARVVCGVLLFFIVTVIVLLLSCLLGWVVAKLSLRLKRKSFLTVLVSLLFIGGYYFLYFKANSLIREIVMNAEVYGERVKGAAYGLYLFGRIGTGDCLSAAVFFGVTLILLALVCFVLSRTFLGIATASGKTEKVRYTEKAVKEKTVFRALLGKEFGRFTASPSYMLNCGLGILFLPALGVLFLIKGPALCAAIGKIFTARPDCASILLCTLLCLAASMNDMAAPSVSLEGKSLWIPRSLPIEPKTALRAKLSVQLILTLIPMLFAAVCTAAILQAPTGEKLLLCCFSLIYVIYSAVFGMVIGVRMPLLNWTNELAPIKQSGAVAIAMFGGWLLSIVFAGLYLLAGYRLGTGVYLTVWTVFLAAAALLLLRWLDTKGAADFAAL